MKRYFSLLSLFTLLLALGFTGSAAARGFGVRVDCRGNGGNPTWAPTSDLVIVMVMINGEWFGVRSGPLTKCTDDRSNSFYIDAFEAKDITQIAVINYGADAFWMDDLEIWYGNFERLAWSAGVDNNVGYCLSTEKSDGNSAYCHDGTASMTFQRSVTPIVYLVSPK
jgi:hypothetical protein